MSFDVNPWILVKNPRAHIADSIYGQGITLTHGKPDRGLELQLELAIRTSKTCSIIFVNGKESLRLTDKDKALNMIPEDFKQGS